MVGIVTFDDRLFLCSYTHGATRTAWTGFYPAKYLSLNRSGRDGDESDDWQCPSLAAPANRRLDDRDSYHYRPVCRQNVPSADTALWAAVLTKEIYLGIDGKGLLFIGVWIGTRSSRKIAQ